MATRSVTKAAALAAAAEVLVATAGSNPSDALLARAAVAQAFIKLGNAIDDDTLTWQEDLAFATGQLKES